MNELFVGFEYAQAYIDNLIIITMRSFEDHLQDLDKVLENLESAGLKTNTTKSNFAAHKLEYLGYWISRDSIQLLASKVEAIKNGNTQK